MSAMNMRWTTSWTFFHEHTKLYKHLKSWLFRNDNKFAWFLLTNCASIMSITSRRNRKCRTYFRWGNIFFVSIRMESWGLGFMFQGIVKELHAFITHYVTFMQVSHKAFGQKLSKSFIFRKRSSFSSLDAFTTGYTRVLSKFGWHASEP